MKDQLEEEPIEDGVLTEEKLIELIEYVYNNGNELWNKRIDNK